jgi:DNA repair protein RecO (recombination protein O)
MTEIITDAFVLRTVDYGDSDVIVTLLGRDLGKFAAIARGAKKSKKRFAGSLLPLRVVKVTARFRPQRDLAHLQGAVVQRDYRGLDTSYDKLTVAFYATELTRCALRDHDEANDTFELLDQVYVRLADADEDPAVLRAILHNFELSMMRVHGAAPSLDACHRCGLVVDEMDKVRCGRDGHGIVCGACVRAGERYGVLESDSIEVLRYLEDPTGRPPDAITDAKVAGQVRRVIDASLELLVDVELRSRPMLDTVFASAPAPRRTVPEAR